MPFTPKELIKLIEVTGQNAVDNVKASIEERKAKRYWDQYYKDSSILMPIFEKDVLDETFKFPKMIIIAEPDEKHIRNDACKRSIGNREFIDGLEILRIYPGYQTILPIRLLGTNDDAFYMDEYQQSLYIGISTYFLTVQKERVRELENLAYSLGAKSITIEEKHKENRFSSIDVEAKGKRKTDNKDKSASASSVELDHGKTKIKIEEGKILASNNWEGNNNPKPIDLIYFKNDETIRDLIIMRMSTENVIKSKTYSILYSDSLGIKANDAAKIDAALKRYKFEVSGKFSKEYKSELLNYFSYTISF